MGYSTDFYGELDIVPAMKPEHIAYLLAFNATRRVARKVSLTAKREDPVRIAAGLPLGEDAGYFVGAGGAYGQEDTPDIKNHNSPPAGQPGLWCQWVPNNEGTAIEWDGGEKFYEYAEWLEYIIEHFLKRWGYTANGSIEWRGEDSGDMGKLAVFNNVLTVRVGYVAYVGEERDV